MTTNLQETYKARRAIIAAREATGREVVHVHLIGGHIATLDRTDFDQLMRVGVSPNWFLNEAKGGFLYVRAGVSALLGWGNNVTVARVITMPSAGEVVHYRDGNPLNLRGANLLKERTTTQASGWESSLPARSASLRAKTSTQIGAAA